MNSRTELQKKIEDIADKHTGEWKAGHNHLVCEQILSAVDEYVAGVKIEVLTDAHRAGGELDADNETDEYIDEKIEYVTGLVSRLQDGKNRGYNQCLSDITKIIEEVL